MLNLWPLFMSEKRKPQTCCHTFCSLTHRGLLLLLLLGSWISGLHCASILFAVFLAKRKKDTQAILLQFSSCSAHASKAPRVKETTRNETDRNEIWKIALHLNKHLTWRARQVGVGVEVGSRSLRNGSISLQSRPLELLGREPWQLCKPRSFGHNEDCLWPKWTHVAQVPDGWAAIGSVCGCRCSGCTFQNIYKLFWL